MNTLYNQVKHDQWRADDIAMPVIARFGTGGGNTPLIVETLVFDEGQITCPTNGNVPTWGGAVTLCPGMQDEQS